MPHLGLLAYIWRGTQAPSIYRLNDKRLKVYLRGVTPRAMPFSMLLRPAHSRHGI